MSTFTGQGGRPLNRSNYQGQQNSNFQGQNNYRSTLDNDNYGGNNFYGNEADSYQETAGYENQGYLTSSDYSSGETAGYGDQSFQTGSDYMSGANARYENQSYQTSTDKSSENTYYANVANDVNASYDQATEYEAGREFDEMSGYETAGYEESYGDSASNTSYYEESSEDYTQSTFLNYSKRMPGYSSNNTVMLTFRGGHSGKGQFGNQMQISNRGGQMRRSNFKHQKKNINQTQNKFRNRRQNNSSQKLLGLPARGRGQSNFNSSRGPFQNKRETHALGQFDMAAKSDNSNKYSDRYGQFDRLLDIAGSKNTVPKAPAEKKIEGEKPVKSGLPNENKLGEKKESDKKEEKSGENAVEKDEEMELDSKDETTKETSKSGKEEISGEEVTNKEELEREKEETKENTEEEERDEDNDSDSSDEDTDFCKYCKLNFSTPKAYHTHTRGLQHTTLVMEAKAKKGDDRFQKEKVEAAVLEVHIPEPKKPLPVKEDIEYDYEENWMNLDEDIIDYMQECQNPESKDLNPNDIGRSALPDDFLCPLCNVKCTGAGAFKMHIDGKQHKSNIEAAKQGAKIKKKKIASSGVMIETTDRPSKIAEMIKDNPAPMLGLEYVTEFQKSDIKALARYVCNLCEAKCDGSTIVPHIVGLKHRLKFMQIKKPQMYEHMNKFNSKKKKSEMNANLEDFAIQIEKEVGRSKVKIKVELEDFNDEDELKETMIRHSKALAAKVKELQEAETDTINEKESPQIRNTKEPPLKKAKIPEGRSRLPRDTYHPERKDPYDHYRRPPYSEIRKPPYDDPRGTNVYPRRQRDDPIRPYDDPRRPPYMESRRTPFDDPRDPYYRRRYPDDFRVSYRDRFDPYRVDDPMYERRMLDERRRLDGLMGERHRLDDPYAERRRVDDILERRRYLDELESARVKDILERRKRLQETDVDYLRLQRFMGREPAPASSSPSLSTEEKTRLDSQLARREALQANIVQEYQETDFQAIQDKLAAHKSSDPNMAAKQEEAAQALKEEAAKNPNVNIAEIMKNLSSSMIATENDAAMALQISNALTQALLKYRLQNVPESLSSFKETIEPMLEQKPTELSIPGLDASSTTCSNVPSFLRSSNDSVRSPLQTVSNTNTSVYQASMPGTLGIPSTSGNLSYSQEENISAASSYQASLSGTVGLPNTSGNLLYSKEQNFVATSQYQASVTGTLGMSSTSGNIPYSQQESFPAASQYQMYRNNTGNAQPSATNTGQQLVLDASLAPVVSSIPIRATITSGITSSSVPVGVTAPTHLITAKKSEGQRTAVTDTSNIDQPQKMLLESIRKQTELLKKKIQASVVSASVSTASGSPSNVLGQTACDPVSTDTYNYPNPYTNYVASSSNQVNTLLSQMISSAEQSGSRPGHVTASTNQAYSLASQVTSSANTVPASQYSSQYYQYNYHSAPPNAAPQPVPPVQPPIPVSQVQPPLPPEPAPPLPTNDLPPLRRRHHR